MNAHFKPYRLIGAQELQTLTQRINNVLDSWNNDYAMHPINSCLKQVSRQPIRNIEENALLVHASQPLALLEGNYLALIKTSLFADESNCFNAAAEVLFNRLISQLLTLSPELVQIDKNSTEMQEWFYPGAPGLVLTLKVTAPSFTTREVNGLDWDKQILVNNTTHRVTLYLHPSWVLPQLIPINKTTKPLSPLSDAFSNHVIHLSVELERLHLSTTQLVHLQVGDVIQTDHPLTLACWLKHQQQTLCQAEIGQIHEHKSIQLSRSL